MILHVGLGLGALAPDLLTVSLLLFAREVRPVSAGMLGFLAGLMEDVAAMAVLGPNVMARTVACIGGSLSREIILEDSPGVVASYLFLGKLVTVILAWAIWGVERPPFLEAIVVDGLVASAYVAVTGWILSPFLIPRVDV